MANLKEYPRSKPESKISKIVIDRDLCIGAASCIAVAGATYELDNENKVVVIMPDGANTVDDDTLILSAESCPTKAIFLYDKEGKQIFPK
ncbi:MAG TPA: ferredoxin [Candidatus Paceibacterota bacterium]|nr:ferredoxin [Candidatus Paceibacterota bacterium]